MCLLPPYTPTNPHPDHYYQLLMMQQMNIQRHNLQHHPPYLPVPPILYHSQLRWGLNFLSFLCDLRVFKYESWPLKANASQAASQCSWQLLSGLLMYR